MKRQVPSGAPKRFEGAAAAIPQSTQFTYLQPDPSNYIRADQMRTMPQPVPYLVTTPTRAYSTLDWIQVTTDIIEF